MCYLAELLSYRTVHCPSATLYSVENIIELNDQLLPAHSFYLVIKSNDCETWKNPESDLFSGTWICYLKFELLYYLITQELPVLIHADRQKRRLYLPKICSFFFFTFEGVKLHLIYSLTKQTLKHRNKAFITSITSG